MQNWKKFSRAILFTLLILGLCAGLAAPRLERAQAAPRQAAATNVVISEFRTRGTNGASDEFIEIYNPTNATISIGNWQVRVLTGSGTESTRATVTAGKNLLPGQYYLIANNTLLTGYSGSVTPDQTYTTGIVDDGGIALFNDLGTKIDSVGVNTTYITYTETLPLSDLSNYTPDANRSYERKLGGALDSCQDNGDNSSDFQLINPSNPQNSSTPRRVCGGDADLSLIQLVDNATQSVGLNVTFTITVSNAGTGDARTVEVKDVLPLGLTYVTSSATLGSYSNGTGIWTVGTLTSGSSAVLTLTATVATGGVKINSAEVWSSYDQDPNSTPGNASTVSENDNASVTVTPPPVGTADVSIVKTVNYSTPNVGDSVVFTITVKNELGPDAATNVIVKDLLPTGFTHVSDTGGGTYNKVTGFWLTGTVPVGASNAKILKITAKVEASGIYTNVADIFSLDQTDSNLTNNSESESVIPSGGISDLRLLLTDAKSTTTAGYVVLTIQVLNDGAYPATNVIVKNDLPTGLTYVSDDSGGSYNKDTDFWSAGAVPLGATGKTLKITVKVDPTGTMTNWAEVWSADQAPSGIDRVYGNGSTTEPDNDDVTVQSADLSIVKSMDNVTPIVGTDVVFTITVSNAGPNTAEDVVIKDLLPVNYDYLSDNSGGDYTEADGKWDVGDIPANTSKVLKITATVLTTTASTFVNWAEVWEAKQVDIDSVPGNNSTNTDDDDSAPESDLRLDQTVSPTYPALNATVIFTVTVSNDGTVGTTGVQVKDKLPAGLTYVSYVSTLGTYTSSTGIWVVGALANGADETLIINAKMTASGVRTNLAEVYKSDLPDPDSTPNNSSTTEDDDASATVYLRPIIINEVAWSGTLASTSDQWIELYNPSSAAVNVTGWTLRSSTTCNPSGNVNITLNGTIAVGGFYLLERDDNNTVRDVTANQVYTGALSTSGETLTLCAGTSVIDTANGNGGAWPKGGTSPNYPTMERLDNTAETDSTWVTNTGVTKNGINATGGVIYGTPGKKNSTGIIPTATPNVIQPTAVPLPRPVINEFLPRPGFDWNQDGRVDVFDEFIEIKNIGVVDVNLSDWQLDDEEDAGSSPFTLPAITLKPGERVVYYALETNILLSDGGDTVRLMNPSEKVYDKYTYSIASFEDKSICRLPDGNGSWYEDCTPTPSQTNTREGGVPSMPQEGYESPVCSLPDTLPADFLFAECRGYGAGIWRIYWDDGYLYIHDNKNKWESFVE